MRSVDMSTCMFICRPTYQSPVSCLYVSTCSHESVRIPARDSNLMDESQSGNVVTVTGSFSGQHTTKCWRWHVHPSGRSHLSLLINLSLLNFARALHARYRLGRHHLRPTPTPTPPPPPRHSCPLPDAVWSQQLSVSLGLSRLSLHLKPFL